MVPGIDIIEQPVLAERTSIRLGGKAVAEVTVSDVACIEHLPGILQKVGGVIKVLGFGTNIIAHDAAHGVTLVRIQEKKPPQIIEETPSGVFIRVGAGVSMPALVRFFVQKGLAGLENLCGIPGNVGGAVAMNAGSFGSAMCDCVHSVRVFTPRQGLVEVPASALCFSYRACVFPQVYEWFLITDVVLRAKPANARQLRAQLVATINRKKAVQPVSAKSAGCVFKNPPQGYSAGQLLDTAGLKGMRLGGMAFSAMHANFLINEGHGTADAAFALLDKAREKVKSRFDVDLELEVKLWR